LLYAIQTLEIHVATIHDIKSPGLEPQFVEDVDIVYFACCDNNNRGNTRTDIQQCVKFDGTFVFAELCPWIDSQTKVYRCRVERVNRFFEFES